MKRKMADGRWETGWSNNSQREEGAESERGKDERGLEGFGVGKALWLLCTWSLPTPNLQNSHCYRGVSQPHEPTRCASQAKKPT